jgi:hypothetical protein
MMTHDGKFSKAAVLAENAADDSPLAFVIIAPVDTFQYFFLDKDPNKQLSDLFVNIGIDLATAAVAGVLAVVLCSGLVLVGVSAGVVVIAGIVIAAIAGWLIKNVEDNAGMTTGLIQLGRKAEHHFIAQGEQVKIDFVNFATESTNAFSTIKMTNDIAGIASNMVSGLP